MTRTKSKDAKRQFGRYKTEPRTVKTHERHLPSGKTVEIKSHKRKMRVLRDPNSAFLPHHGDHVADKDGIRLTRRETSILRSQRGKVEHAGGFDFDAKKKAPSRQYIERGHQASVYVPIKDDPDYEVVFHTHPDPKYRGSVEGMKLQKLGSRRPSVGDIDSLRHDIHIRGGRITVCERVWRRCRQSGRLDTPVSQKRGSGSTRKRWTVL